MLEIIDFYAVWCGPCKVMEPIIEELKKELDGKAKVTIINVDESPDEPARHNVLSIPTYIVKKDGQEVERFIGVTPKQKFIDAIKKYS